jgi:hypothetical protein
MVIIPFVLCEMREQDAPALGCDYFLSCFDYVILEAFPEGMDAKYRITHRQ